eukprot:TRINITY_DN5263_c0_g1_i1.p1 TRINITY_DN5263_c0_g1~~TRINITY_DN5263_c0_g1_i1.p1  ORF type:complete len:166 (-),score=13.54 TRINITY_DN5263_c0_g1_i1:144-641(-)
MAQNLGRVKNVLSAFGVRSCHYGRPRHAPPHVLADKLRRAGQPVPGFLLKPHEAGHIPPHQALSSLTAELRARDPTSPLLSLVSQDPWGSTHPAHPPHHPEHQPPHQLAMQLQREIDLASGKTIAGAKVFNTPGVESVVRQLQHRVAELEKENAALRAAQDGSLI